MAYRDCKPGYSWYVCSGGRPFRGCCRIDACNGGCPPGDLEPSDDGGDDYTTTTTTATISNTRTTTRANTASRTTRATSTKSSRESVDDATSTLPDTSSDAPASSTTSSGPSAAPSEASSHYYSSSPAATLSSGIEAPTSSAASKQGAPSINTGGLVGGIVAALLVIFGVLLFLWLRKRKAALKSSGADPPFTSYSPPRWSGPPFINAIMGRFSSRAPVDAQLPPQPPQSPNQEMTELPGDSVHRTQPRSTPGVMSELPGESAPPQQEIYSPEGVLEAAQRERVQSSYANQVATLPARSSVSSLRAFPNPSPMGYNNAPRPLSAHGYPRYSHSPVSPEISQGSYTPTSAGASQGRQPAQGDWEVHRSSGHSQVSPEIPQSGHTPTSPGSSYGWQPARGAWANQRGPGGY